MEEIDELRAKALASMSATPNPSPELANKPSNIREEGELSSSDNDELPAYSAAQSTGTAAPPVEHIPVVPVKKYTQDIKAGKSVSANNPASFVDIQSRTSVKPNYRKSFEKNRVPFKSGATGWYVPSKANNNLVISFSDDDSGSDSEEHRQEKALETKGSTLGVDGNGRPPSSLAKSEMLRRTIRNETKVMPKKASLSRTFISSMTKIHGANTSSAGPSLVEQGSRVINSNTLNKKISSRERGCNQGVNLNNSKLQDLRQQIAIRESELRLKSAQQNRENASGSCRDYNVMNLNNDAARKSRATSGDIVQLESKEPDKKRLKVNELYSSQLNSDGQQEIPAAKSILALKDSVLGNSGLQDRNTVDPSRCDKEIPMGTPQVKWQKQDDRQVPVSFGNLPSGVKDGADVITSCSQSDKSTRLVDPSVMLNQTASLVNATSKTLAKKSSALELKHPSKISGHHLSGSVPNKATCEHGSMKSSEDREVISGDKTPKPTSENICQPCSLHVPDSKLETSDASLNNGSLWNCLGKVNISGHSNMDIQSLVEIEELQDKELDEAQEHRRRCEIEERNALKAYRKAQRALFEANARCTHLYQKRELYSAQFRSFIMEDSSLLWSSRQHKPFGIGLNSSNNVSEINVDLEPTPSHQMQAEFDVFNQPGYDSNIQCADGALLNTSYRHVDGQNLGSEPCSEPDASTSELLPHKGDSAANGLSTPSNISADEDEGAFPFDHKSVRPNLECQREEEHLNERENDINGSKRKFSVDSSQDSLLLEASLRSKLFARLGVRTLSNNSGPGYSVEPAVERGAENDVESEKTQISMGNAPFSEAEKSQHSYLGGTDKPERSVSEMPVQIHNQCCDEKCSFNYASHTTADLEENRCSIRGHQSTTSVTFSLPSILRSAFGHMKVTSPIRITGLQNRHQQNHTYDNYIEEGIGVSSDQIHPSLLIANSTLESVRDIFVGEIGSYTCNLAIDPLWPLCMYELRGKCNNEECSWQHVKDYSNRSCQVGSLSRGVKFNGATKLSKAPPTYLVCLDILKADLHSYESVLARSIGQGWQKCFSTSLAVSSLLQNDLPSDEPFLHGCDGRIEVHGSWNKQSLYFQSRNGAVNQLKQGLGDNEQSLEMALLILNQEVNKQESMKKALSVLSRALEADPTSVVLWIVYLHIYYSNKKSIGKDDMFFYAIKPNEGSYELWLMYINSRMQLDDRLVAYDTALSALCRHASASDRDALHGSACILDLFLQMMDFLCMSGDVWKAIQKISELFPAATKSDEFSSLLLSDILTCLTVSDKCIFWVCCVYLVIYRKLPDAVVQLFECEKELFSIEWPSIHLTVDEKQQAVKMMELAVDSVALYIDSETIESETTLRLAHLFALSHVRCIAVLDGLDCSRHLLDKYIKLYPSCLELLLLSARIQKNDFEGTSFVGFEEALSNWPNEVPGLQCIWNQYAEYALQNGRIDFSKELMVRWFHSVWNVQYPQNGIVDPMDGDNSSGSLESASASNLDSSTSNSKQMDVMFGLLNLSLHRLLQNDHIEARLAIDRALKVAAPEDFKHCLREHAMFLLTDGSQLKEDSSVNEILNILNGYMADTQDFPLFQPLSRKFIQNIKKPRVRQLISNILSPVSSDFSLVNLVLEVWRGPSLLPPKFSKIKDLVDFVEAIMGISPSNYQLAISVCKLLTTGSNYTDVASASVLFWASSTLVNSIFQAVPVAPEYIWVEAAGILGNLTDIQAISERFHKRALSVYPFSIKLWKSYLNISETTGNTSTVIAAATERGIKLD